MEDTAPDDRETAPGEPDLPPDSVVGDYVLQRRLGRGGFGTVYLAVHPVIGKQAAIKVLARRFASDPNIVSRFVAEARAVNQIRHHNIVDIFGFGQLPDGRHFYVMELLEGDSLERTIATRGPLPLAEALPIARGIARALDAAHAKGIAHRDLKPENIMLVRDSEGRLFPKLLDFGIAKLLAPELDVRHKTGTGVPIGTPYYMSPEQCRGRDVDHRTDLYSFGILLYRMLTAQFPFDGDYAELLFKQINDTPLPPTAYVSNLPREVDDAVAWLMRKQPDERPPSALAAVQHIDPASGSTPSIPSSIPSSPSIPDTPRASRRDAVAVAAPTVMAPDTRIRHRRRFFGVAIAAVLAVGGLVAVFVIATSAGTPPTTTPATTAAGTPAIERPAANDAALVEPAADAAPLAAVTDAPEASSHVIIQIKGVPANTEVSMGTKVLGTAPGPIQLDRGTRDVVLTFNASGYLPQNLLLKPDADREATVTLKPRPRRPGTPGPSSRDQVIESNELFKKGKR